MIIETWFILAVLSALSGGVMSFLFKVAAKENVDIVLLSFWNSVFATVVLFFFILIYSDFSAFWHPMLLFAGATAFTFLITNVLKVKALENIDAAIFFPLYKVFGPMLVILISIVVFKESFSAIEWIGLILSLVVPFLLITSVENDRQINLKSGLFWLSLVVLVGAISAATWKYGADIAPNTWMYILAVETSGLLTAALALSMKKGLFRRPTFSIFNRKVFLKMLLASTLANLITGVVFVFALTTGGPLGIVYTISSLYILVPIVLAIIYYKEHWNLRKATAIILSVVALAFFA